jgi:hypothetical protein
LVCFFNFGDVLKASLLIDEAGRTGRFIDSIAISAK